MTKDLNLALCREGAAATRANILPQLVSEDLSRFSLKNPQHPAKLSCLRSIFRVALMQCHDTGMPVDENRVSGLLLWRLFYHWVVSALYSISPKASRCANFTRRECNRRPSFNSCSNESKFTGRSATRAVVLPRTGS